MCHLCAAAAAAAHTIVSLCVEFINLNSLPCVLAERRAGYFYNLLADAVFFFSLLLCVFVRPGRSKGYIGDGGNLFLSFCAFDLSDMGARNVCASK